MSVNKAESKHLLMKNVFFFRCLKILVECPFNKTEFESSNFFNFEKSLATAASIV